jgi:hypothetical protein
MQIPPATSCCNFSIRCLDVSLRLATVELQLCMHFLTTPHLVSLSRCSRFTLACASSEVAWCFAAPFPILFVSPGSFRPDEHVSAGLVRFYGFCIHWTDHVADVMRQTPADDTEVDEIFHIPPVRAINAEKRRLDADSLLFLGSQSSFSLVKLSSCITDAKQMHIVSGCCGSVLR